ncbi:hypothetical protein Aperf_G00000081224 [Anoplocephala perfoliata]
MMRGHRLQTKSLRQLHGCPPLQLNFDLASSAQAYADLLASTNAFQHSGKHDVGENLAKQTGLPESFSAAQVTLLWYNEIKDYQFSGQDQLSCGHFSQVIWKDTTSMGMGKTVTPDGHKVIVVGHYQPPGNYIGEWGANVPSAVHGINRALTLEELTKGMDGDLFSNDKENMAQFRKSQNESEEGNRQSGYENNRNGESGYTEFCKERSFGTGCLVENEYNNLHSPAEPGCEDHRSSNEETSTPYRKPSKNVIVDTDIDDTVVRPICESTYQRLHENEITDVREKGKKFYAIKRPINLRDKYSGEQRNSWSFSTSESGYYSNSTPLTDLDNLNSPSVMINASKMNKSDVFAVDVFIELSCRRLANGLHPFSLSRTLDEIAREIAKDLKNGGDLSFPSGKWRGKLLHFYSESWCLFDKNVSRFVQRCCNSRIRLAVMDPNCEYVAIGCDFDRPFKKSVAVIIFA